MAAPATTAVNFAVGTTALLLALAVEHALGHGWTAPPLPWEQPVLWLGGPVGILFIVGATVVVKPLGVLLYGLLSIAGQLSTSLLLDLVLPTPGTVVTWQLITGVVLTGFAVAWAAQTPRSVRTA
jgi:transporter family-2 protein